MQQKNIQESSWTEKKNPTNVYVLKRHCGGSLYSFLRSYDSKIVKLDINFLQRCGVDENSVFPKDKEELIATFGSGFDEQVWLGAKKLAEKNILTLKKLELNTTTNNDGMLHLVPSGTITVNQADPDFVTFEPNLTSSFIINNKLSNFGRHKVKTEKVIYTRLDVLLYFFGGIVGYCKDGRLSLCEDYQVLEKEVKVKGETKVVIQEKNSGLDTKKLDKELSKYLHTKQKSINPREYGLLVDYVDEIKEIIKKL